MIDWKSIQEAVGMINTGGARQIKNKEWTAYRTESCIRIDLFIYKENL